MALSRREADLAIRLRPQGAPPADENVVCRKLFDVPWALHAAPTYVADHGAPHDPDDLDGHEVIGFDDEAPALPGREWLRRASAKARVRLRATSLLTVVSAARAGLGLGLMPCMFGHGRPPLLRVSEPAAIAEAWLLVHPDLQQVARMRALIDALVELARRDKDWMHGGARHGARNPSEA